MTRTVGPIRLLPALFSVGAGAAAVRLFGVAKELAVAHRFGTGDALDAFLIAFAVPAFVAGTVRSALFSSFVPRFVAARERDGSEAAGRLLASSASRLLIAVLATTLLLALGAKPLVSLLAVAFEPEKRLLTERLFVALLPFVLLDAAAGLWAAALHAEGRHVRAAVAPAAIPIATLGFVLFAPTLGAFALASGAVAGAALEAAYLSGSLARRGFRPFRWGNPSDPAARATGRSFLILAGGGALMSANPVVDQVMAGWLGPGSVAALSFGGRAPGAILGLAGVALGTASLPYFSKHAASDDPSGLAAAFRRQSLRIVLGSLVLAAALAAASFPIVRILFERGAFEASDTATVAPVQALYALQIPGYLFGILAARLLNALGRDRAILGLSAGNAAVNFAANLLLMRVLGIAGIALATSVVYTLSALALWAVARRALARRSG